MESYDHQKIERKWQKKWEESGLYRATDFDKKEKFYVLIEFPYPSGEKLHVGHGRSYCCFDAVARLKKMKGYNVLFPMGWDAFGLPAENYAIKTGIHPAITVRENIAKAREQAHSWGLSFDWDREINTTDPAYYKWTQWIFLQFFKKGLAYKAEVPVNWCPKDKINLADEEVIGGCCERCGTPVTRRTQSQWMLKITSYADRLLEDLKLVDYREDIKQQQINWIGRSEGVEVKFPLTTHDSRLATNKDIHVFTTRIDTIFGVTFLVLSPEKAQEYLELMPIEQREAVEKYIERALKKSELQRQEEIKTKTGVFTGIYVKNPLSEEHVPLWVSDFVLGGYGTGAVMAVPAHDQRDFEFAKKYDLPIKRVIAETRGGRGADQHGLPWEGEGFLVDSAKFSGLQSKSAIDKIADFLTQKGLGKKTVSYKLRDWVFSRQHYWGEPIPIIFCRNCWEVKSSKLKAQSKEGYDYVVINGQEHAVIAVPENQLPVELPYVKNYQPTETGESPLAEIKDWVEMTCPSCGGRARRETDTMPNWAGSSWYYLRYIDPHNSKRFADSRKLKYWLPVDWYNGGLEHTTLHLLYSRFWHKFLFDLGLVPTKEPYAKRTSHGVVLGPDGQRMSKSRGNVINPDDVVEEFGADTFRMYEAFMGPFDQMISWDSRGVLGVRRFLEKVWKTHQAVSGKQLAVSNPDLKRKLHQLIRKVEEDTLSLKFNTAVAAMMEFVNEVASCEYQVAREDWGIFLQILAPYAPYLTEELWQELRSRNDAGGVSPLGRTQDSRKSEFSSVHEEKWPRWNPKLMVEEKVTVIVQVDGKFRGKLEVAPGTKEEELIKLAQALESAKAHLLGRRITKTIFRPNSLVNFVTAS